MASSSLPPRVLNVQKFAESRSTELESLHAIISSRNKGKFHLQRCKRRRTSSHDARIAGNKQCRKRPRLEKRENSSEKNEKEKKLSRRIRRRMMLRKNVDFGFSVAGDGTERLRTHLWHAKRFTMVKRWGFYLPLGVHGRGRGSRALLKRLKSGALVHDASYLTAIQLEGLQGSVLDILRKILVQPEINSQLVLRGMCHQRAMLHHIGAPSSRFICPVMYLWRPVIGDVSTSCRQLMMWVHASAFNEAFDVISAASQEQKEISDGAPVSCVSLKGKLGKLDLIGPKATHILQKIISSSSNLSKPSKDSSTSKENALHEDLELRERSTSKLSMIFEGMDKIPSHAVISLDVLDPRDSSFGRADPDNVQIQSDFPNEETVVEPSTAPAEPIMLKSDSESSFWPDLSQNAEFISDSKELWDSLDKLKPPFDDYSLCLEKHHRRLRMFRMDDFNPYTFASESRENGSRICPVLLLKNNFHNTDLNGWSIILPLSWIKSFWVSIISCGGCAIGLREKRWVALEGRIPSFPFDFPDCKAYNTLMDVVASEFDLMADLRPPSVRPIRVPIPPPWGCIKSSVQHLPALIRENGSADDERLSHFIPEISSSIGESSSVNSFPGSIIRSDGVLHLFLKDINGEHLLLFCDFGTGKKYFSDLIDRGKMSWVPRNMKRLFADRSLIFSRVLLYPCWEGAFEEGAVVCAPLFSDILSLSSRDEERESLCISQSMVNSYFMQSDSGKWVMPFSEDPFHRWPIGFTTSGSTRGSSHQVAMAACEVTLLAQLREQQWSQMLEKSKPEVFVLVRNIRSTAYRLCRASIYLEQAHDFDFL